MMSNYFLAKSHREKGFVLAISMIFLIVMTLLAVAAIKRSTLDEKITANLRTQNLSFQAAEKALRFCERFLDLAAGSVTICTAKQPANVILDPNPGTQKPNAWEDNNNWKVGGLSQLIPKEDPPPGGYPDPDLGVDTTSQPRCMVEEWRLNPANGNKQPAWIITARAGPRIDATASEKSENAVIWLQEVIRCGNF